MYNASSISAPLAAASSVLRKYNILGSNDPSEPYTATVAGITFTSASFGSHIRYYVAAACVLVAIYALWGGRADNVDVPFFKASKLKWMFEAEQMVCKSYNQFYGKVYKFRATEGTQVMIPANLIGEVKSLPEEILSAVEALNEAMLSDYTHFTLGKHGERLSSVIRTKLSQNLARLVPRLRTEIEYVVATEFPACDDWTPVKVHPFGVRAIARLSGRAFVGADISRAEPWMDTSINYAIHVFMAVVKLQFIPAWLRPVGQFLVGDLRRIEADIQRAEAMLRPIMDERLRDMETPGFEDTKKDDLIQWLLDTLPPSERRDYRAQAELQLVLSAASIHTTNNLLVDCFYDLAAHPAVQAELRDEVLAVLCSDEAWSRKDSMVRLRKMDSFVKEVQRLNGNITGFIRKVMQPIELSDGTRLPRGTKVLAPQAGFSVDAAYYSDPETFDALRFYRMRAQSAEDAHRWQFSSIGDINMNFGAGKHACPGRFFAGNEIKMMLAHFLTHFELRLKDGAARPAPIKIMMCKTPDPNGEVLFRRRRLGCD